MSDKKPSNFLKPCETCHAQVHFNARTCKCGAPNPWRLEEQRLAQKALPHIASRDFGAMVGIQFREFKEGERITDAVLVGQLLDAGCPIEPYTGQTMLECPHCHRLFVAKAAEPAPEYSPETAEKIQRLGLS